MIGNSTYEYLFIQACIFGLHCIAPLSISYCLVQILRYGLNATLSYRLPVILELWAAAEAVFYLGVHLWYRKYLQVEAQHPPSLSRQGRRELFAHCNKNIPDREAYLQKWFLGAPAETIKKENLKEFLSWAFLNKDGPAVEDDEELDEYVVATERLLGRKVEKGRGSAKCLRLTLDPVNTLHRSILWYWCVGFVDFLTFCRLQYYGFHFHRTALSRFFTLFPLRPVALFSRHRSPVKHTTYWHRPHNSHTKLPIVFVHGIGIGLYPYVDFLRDLNSTSGVENGGFDDQVGIIAIEIMPVSSRITHHALTKEVICDEIQAITKSHGFEKYVLVAHSYGTAVATYMIKSPKLANQIGPVMLIDPITILLHLPDVAYNFTRRQPTRANEHQLYYFGSMDMGVSHTLARSFFWSDVILWKEDLGDRRVTFSLAQKDLIVNTEDVGRYVASPDCDLTENKHDNDECDGYVQSNDKLSLEANGQALCSSKANGNGHLTPNGRLGNAKKTIPNGHAITHAERTRCISPYQDWKSQPWRGRGLEVLWQHGIDHAQVFDSAKRRTGLISAIKNYSAQPPN